MPTTPTKIAIPFPSNKQIRGRGIYATTSPYGVRATVNFSTYEIKLIDAACQYIDHGPSRSAFMRQVCTAMAVAILELFETDNPLVRTYHERLADGYKDPTDTE
jgi:hypothetical protein